MKNKILSMIESLLTDQAFISAVKHSTEIFPANTKILSEGQIHSNFYIIKEGKVRILLAGTTVKAIHPGVADLGPGDIFGEYTLFEELPASADVIATSDIELIKIDIPSFLVFLESNPSVGYQFLRELFSNFVKRLQIANKKVLRLLEWGLNAHDIDKHL